MPTRNASPLLPHREARCALGEEINAYNHASSAYVLIRIVATPHRHGKYSKCRVAGAIGRIKKVEEGDVAFISAIARVPKWY